MVPFSGFCLTGRMAVQIQIIQEQLSRPSDGCFFSCRTAAVIMQLIKKYTLLHEFSS